MVELSAMERDIFICTGYLPDKLRKVLGPLKLEANDITTLIQLIKSEGSRLPSATAPL